MEFCLVEGMAGILGSATLTKQNDKNRYARETHTRAGRATVRALPTHPLHTAHPMFKPLQTLDQRTRTLTLLLATLAAFALNLLASAWLNSSYAASGFPVPYFEAQLSFDAAKLKGWYAQLLQAGTLGLYRQTQHIDFLFIATVALLHPLALLLVGRLFSASSRARGWLVVAAGLSLIAPVADGLENAVSYVMLANPLGFNVMWAQLYSSLAALKFVMFTLAYVAAAIGIVWGLVHWVQRRLQHGSRPAM